MLVLVCGVLAVLSPLLFGGDLRRFGQVHLRLVWLPVVALAAQFVIIEVVPDASRTLLEQVHLGTYVAAGVFVAVNWRVPGLLVVAAGGAVNGVTIALNGGTLPASADALRAAGFTGQDVDFINSTVLENPVLPIFGDIFAWPAPLPLANVFSFGDILIVIGAAYGAHRIAGSRLVRSPWSPVSADVVPAPTPELEELAASSGGSDRSLAPVPMPGAPLGFAPPESLSPLQQRLAELRTGGTGGAGVR